MKKPKIEKGETLYRAIQLTRAAVDAAPAEKNTLRMSISSDEPYLRYDFWNDEEYYEILDHAPGGVDESRLKTGLPILFNHDRDKHLGRAPSYQNDGHKIIVDAKFSESDFAQEKLKDAMSGVLPDASIGYSLEDEGVRVGAKEGVPIYKFKWKPFEASLVTIPADTTVGVGRSRQTNFRSKTMKTNENETETEERRMTQTQSEMHAEKIRELGTWFKTKFSRKDALPFDAEEEAERCIAKGMTASEFQKYVAGSIALPQRVDAMNYGDHGNGRVGIAEQIIAHPEMKRALEGGQKTVSFVLPGFRSFREGLKRSTNVTTDVGPPSQYLPQVMGVAYEILVVADLLAPGTMDTSQITFPKEVGPFVSNAAATAEVAAKPEQAFSVVPATVAAKKVAAWTKISTELAQDSPAAVSYINNRLGFAVQKAEDLQILRGDGMGANFLGIHNTPGIQVQVKGGDTAIDAIRKAIANVEVNSDFICSGIVLHPTDFANIEMLKDTLGRYIVGQVLIRGELGQNLLAPSLWGRPIAVSKSETPGQALVGAFNTAAQLFRRIGLLIEMTNANENDFIRNLLAIRAELRAALAVYAGNAFCEITGL